jgi:HK97 gp10 family phage protein
MSRRIQRRRSYRTKLVLQTLQGSTVADSRGHTQRTFSDKETLWGAVESGGGREMVLAREIQPEATHLVETDYTANGKPRARLKIESSGAVLKGGGFDMSDGVSIGLVGDQAYMRKLERLAKKDSRRALAKGTRAGAKVLLPIVKGSAPRRSGHLRTVGKVRATKRSRRFVGATVTVQAPADRWYAPFVEWGTKHMSGVRYIERAARRAWRSATIRAVSVIKNHIEEAARR